MALGLALFLLQKNLWWWVGGMTKYSLKKLYFDKIEKLEIGQVSHIYIYYYLIIYTINSIKH